MKTRRLTALLLILMLAVTLLPAAQAESYLEDEARSMLSLINDFRTGSNAWYWNADNTTWTTMQGLSALTYDSALEEVAKTRAKELSVRFSHDRPDGSKWSTAFPAGNYYKGENIACGFETAQDAFNGFLEENENYAGQGHRRNMLRKEFTRVGLAAFEVNGTIYWVQEFASAFSGGKNGGKAKAGWEQQDGKYYYKQSDGTYAKGWLKVSGKWYYLDETDGAMYTGWLKSDGNRYYFNESSGEMTIGWMKGAQGWYCFDKKGVLQTGWFENDSKWYYADKDGFAQTGWQKIKGKKYHFADSGAMDTGWLKDGKKWYYLSGKGVMQTGWQEIDGDWYYFRSSGEMVTGTVEIDGKQERFSKKGVWQGTSIDDYDTPLGGNDLIFFIRRIHLLLQEINAIASFH